MCGGAKFYSWRLVSVNLYQGVNTITRGGLMSRKERKNKRKNKPKLVKPGKALDLLARAMGRRMTKLHLFNTEDTNKKVWCKVCKQYYCLGFDGVDVFCRDCFYRHIERESDDPNLPNGCQKKVTGGRICQFCNH
jgi:hypothetical protein